MKTKAKHKNELKMNNVFRASWGYNNPYNDNQYSKELQELLRPYVENGLLKTDFKSLQEVAKILQGYSGEIVVVDSEGTITFYNTDY